MFFRKEWLKLLKQRTHISWADAVWRILGRHKQGSIYSHWNTEDKSIKSAHLSLTWITNALLGLLTGTWVTQRQMHHQKTQNGWWIKKLHHWCWFPIFMQFHWTVSLLLFAAFLSSPENPRNSWVSCIYYISSASQVLGALFFIKGMISTGRK